MLDHFIDALSRLVESVSDALSALVDMVGGCIDIFSSFVETALNVLVDAIAHAGVPTQRTIDLRCGGRVNIDYYLRSPG